jgi:hypothetical protein
MEDPRLGLPPRRPYRPLLDWTRVRERVAHAAHLVQKEWPQAAIDSTFDWRRARLLWAAREADPHRWGTAPTLWHAMQVRSLLQQVSVFREASLCRRPGGLTGLESELELCAPLRWRSREETVGGCWPLVLWLASRDDTASQPRLWQLPSSRTRRGTLPWRGERTILFHGDESIEGGSIKALACCCGQVSPRLLCRLLGASHDALFAAHLLNSALFGGFTVLLGGYLLTSPVTARLGRIYRLAVARRLATRGRERFAQEVRQVQSETRGALSPMEQQTVARLRLSTGADPPPGTSQWWVVTDFGYPFLDEAGSTSGEEPEQCRR